MSTSPARTLKSSRRFQRRRDRLSPNPQWQFLRGFLKNPVMVGSIIPSSKVLIEKMLAPVDWANTRLFVEYGPGVGTFTRPVLEQMAPDATLVTVDTNPDFTRYLKESIEDPRLVAVTGSAADVEHILADRGLGHFLDLGGDEADLDCGACCGQPGDVNARAAAALLNEADVRAGLAARGIVVPPATLFWAYKGNPPRDGEVAAPDLIRG